MTVYDNAYTFRSRHNLSKHLNFLCFSLALTSALPLASEALAGGGNSGSMYFNVPQQAQEAAAAASRGAVSADEAPALRIGASGASENIVSMVTASAERHGVPVALAHAVIK